MYLGRCLKSHDDHRTDVQLASDRGLVLWTDGWQPPHIQPYQYVRQTTDPIDQVDRDRVLVVSCSNTFRDFGDV